MQRHVARLENGPDLDGERFAARPAIPKAGARALALHLCRLADNAAVRADRTIRPKPALDILDRGFLISKVGNVQKGLHGRSPRST